LLARSPLLRRLPPIAERCSQPQVRATTFRFKASDGVLLDGAVLGGGPVGIVLAHESGGDLCRWVPYGDLLSKEGFRVLVFDYRGLGLSAGVAGKRADRIDLDVLAATAELRRRGAEKIVLIGASVGGVAVVTAGASARPAVDGVVSISGADTGFLRRGGYPYAVLDPSAAAARLRSAVLFISSKDDAVLPVASTRKLYRAAAATDKRLVVVPGSSHGVSIVDDPEVRNLILEFIRDHTGD
jgi:pimeloyl-ACP methyl ester carboxylesterase